MEEATFLTKYGSHVYIIHRRDSFRASKVGGGWGGCLVAMVVGGGSGYSAQS